MKRIAWLTDVHLNFLNTHQIESFCQSIVDAVPDTVLLGGDVSVAKSITEHLVLLEKLLRRPIYFVLGNHDFYGGSIATVRSRVAELGRNSSCLHWLPGSGAIELTEHTGLIGHGGWADGRLGNSVRSQVLLNDYFYIDEFIGLSVRERFAQLNALGDEAADHLRRFLPAALDRFRRLLLLTHVPPFKESCWHQGRISDDEFLPHFACRVMGDVLVEVMKGRPESELTVLCGHTHSQGEAEILPNLFVKTGAAVYGSPRVQELIAVD